MIAIQLLNMAYASVGIIATIGYAPTIIDLYKRKMSANSNSYMIFTFCAATTLLYGMQFSDMLLNIVNGLNVICCASILALTLNLKRINTGVRS